MSLWVRSRPQQQRGLSTVEGPLIPSRNAPTGTGYEPSAVNPDVALRNSAVWACLRLRADLMSTFPLDVYRKVRQDGTAVRVEVPKPAVLVEPGGEHWDYVDWMWASQFDQDRAGNSIGLITERYGNGLPARIELQPLSVCTVLQRKGQSEHRYRIDGKEYTADKVWHERQFPVAGTPIGLSPVAYAAWTLAENMTMQDFSRQWFSRSGVPRARLRNTQKKLDAKEARIIKNRHKASLQHGDLFVHGVDWEYDLMQAEQAGMEFIEGRRFTLADICRYFGAPADLIEVAVQGGSTVNYANITQRHLQFLILHLGPAVARREKNLTKLLSRPRYVKLNTDALLRMDPLERARVITERVTKSKTMTNTEARALDDQLPLSPEQIAEFETLYGPPGKAQQQPADDKEGTQ